MQTTPRADRRCSNRGVLQSDAPPQIQNLFFADGRPHKRCIPAHTPNKPQHSRLNVMLLQRLGSGSWVSYVWSRAESIHKMLSMNDRTEAATVPWRKLRCACCTA